MLKTYTATKAAAYISNVTQAVVNNLAPLLFLTFETRLGVGLARLTGLVALNFFTQVVVDVLASAFMDRVGYRPPAVAAHLFCFAGLVAMGTLPRLTQDPYTGLVAATLLLSAGGGLIEVILSPIVEALPGDAKAASMSLLHSFYCWGHIAVVLLSTLFFVTLGTARWHLLPLLWALVPLGNALLFCRVPLRRLNEGKPSAPAILAFFRQPAYLLLILVMLCSGASEQAIAQWASYFSEVALGISKTLGDLLGPCLFALLMGVVRLVGGMKKTGAGREKALVWSGALCIFSFCLIVFAPGPLLSLLGVGLCGLSVGLMWPGAISLGAKTFPRAGTAMFAFLALAGDIGCILGPGLVGGVAARAKNALGLPGAAALKAGILAAVVFPIALLVCLRLLVKRNARESGTGS